MDVGIYFSGEFGRRFVLNLAYPELCPYLGACGVEFCDRCKNYDFSSSIVDVREFPEHTAMGNYIENTSEFFSHSPEMEVTIAINLHPDILIDLPEIVSTKLLIIPIEDPKWCSAGLKNQIKRICSEIGIEFSAPKPFCSLKPDGNLMNKFCKEFKMGSPEFDLRLKDNCIENANTLSDTCGCAHYVSKKMRGYIIDDIHTFWQDIHQHQCAYPCLASMERDFEIKEAIFHLAGYIMIYKFSKSAGIPAESFIPEHMRNFII